MANDKNAMIHTGLTLERWSKFSVFEQLANVGTDIARAFEGKKKNNAQYSEKAFERAMELLDLTIADPKNRGGALKELARVREALKDHFLCDNEYETTEQFWQDYFYHFNYAAALQKGR
jgi:phosphoenolpyruvate carboxylase